MGAGLIAGIIFGLPRLYTSLRYASRIQSEQNAPSAPVAIVFGAGLRRDGSASVILRDRVETAAQLYWTGKASKLLLSGDNRFENYNEPRAMLEYGLQLGLPESAMTLDYAGRRTYDTCLRAKEIFGVSQALLVTQHYHLDRALLTDVGGAAVPLIELADLIIAKVLAGRLKDLDDAAGLWRLHAQTVDAGRIRRTLRLLEEALSQGDLVSSFDAITRAGSAANRRH